MTAGLTFYYAVEAVDTQGNVSPMSQAVKFTVPNPPAAPAGLAGAATSTTKIGLTWDVAASGGLSIRNYTVYRGSSTSNMPALATLSKTSYTDATVSAGLTYYYAVQASDTGGDLSPVSNAIEVTSFTPPQAPANLTAVPASTTKVSVAWNTAVSGGLPIRNYTVSRGSSISNLAPLFTTPNTSYSDTSAVSGTTYYYGVQATDTGANLSPMSTPVKVTMFTPPSAPTGLTVVLNAGTKATLTWSASASGGLPVTYYQVFRGTSASNVNTKLATVSSTTYVDKTLVAGTTYYYGVEAEDSATDLSPMSSVVPSTGYTPPSPPANVAAVAMSATRVSVTWSAAVAGTLPIQYYQVLRGAAPGATLSQVATTSQTSFMDTTVSQGNTYYYAVQSQDTGGDLSAISGIASVAVPVLPSPPANVVPTPMSATRIVVTWAPAASGGLPVTYYQVSRGLTSNSLTQVATVSQTTYTDQSVTQGTKYYYGVQAQDSGGDTSVMSAPPVLATAPTPPSAPTGLVATPTSGTMVSLTWNAAASGGLPIQLYQVFRGTSQYNLTQITTVTQTAATDTSLTPGSTYYYKVIAEDSGADLSPSSAIVSATVFSLPSTPAGLAAVVTSNIPAGAPQATYSVGLTWSASTGGGLPVQFYQVLRGNTPGNLSQIASVNQTFYTDTSVSAGTTYYYAVIAADSSGDLSPASPPVAAIISGGQVPGSFNVLPMNINSFSPSSTVLPGLPQMNINGTLYDEVGYQSGVVLNGKVIYNANEVWVGSTSWMGAVGSAVPMPVFIAYDATQQLGGFANASNWTWFDSSTLQWYNQGTPQIGNTGNQCIDPQNDSNCLNIAGAYMGRSAYVGNIYYPTPDFHNGYMVFLSFDSSKAINDPTAYQTFVPPGYYLSSMGQQYGWCSSVTDGRFVYYTPLGNPVTGNSGNIFRYDTTQPFSNLATGGQTAAWQNFDMQNTPANPSGIDPNAAGFQSAAYDGNRYIYFIPFQQTLIVRYDTWNGGSAPDPTGFTVAANYVTLDPTQLGTAGYPLITGQGNTANLAGFTGSQVVWDAANDNEYLYLVPWGTYPNNASNPTLQSTAVRVRIGSMAGGSWKAVDITSTATSPSWSTPNWEMYDLTLLQQNPAWPSNWPLLQTTPQFSTQSALAGWQEAFAATSNSEGQTFPPRVGFVPDTSQFLVEHDVGHDLFDPTGWYITLIPSTYNYGTMGGGYDAANGILYPASPNVPLFAFQF